MVSTGERTHHHGTASIGTSAGVSLRAPVDRDGNHRPSAAHGVPRHGEGPHRRVGRGDLLDERNPAESPAEARLELGLPMGFHDDLSLSDLGLLLRIADEVFTTEGLPPYRPG